MKDLEKYLSNEPDDQACKICFVRLNHSERIQHIIFLACFFILVITGFMVKTPEEVVNVLGKAGETVFFIRGLLHRIAGVVIILTSLYHVYYVIFKRTGRRWIIDMIPRIRDLKDMVNNILYYLGIKESHPEFDRFNYKHKIEYWALIAGSILMSITGIIMWLEYMWSKFVLDIAIIVHGMEAVLASLAIIIWHLYEVHLHPRKFPIDNMWLTGVIDEEDMKDEYILHYKKIMADEELQKMFIERRRIERRKN